MNFSKARRGRADAAVVRRRRTLFHEFGHALHGAALRRHLSDGLGHQRAHRLGRAAVAALRALAGAARKSCAASRCHYRTGEPMPEDLLRRLLAARTFNQGFATVEYVASALVDLDLHLQPRTPRASTSTRFEQATLARIGMPAEIVMRHRPPHFAHVFAGGGYAVGLLQLHVVGGARRRRLRGVRGDRRHLRSGDREEAARQRLCRRRLARSGRALHRLPRPAADARSAAAQARA